MNPEPALPTTDAPSSGGVITASYRRDDVLRAGNQAFRRVKCLGLGAMGEAYEVDHPSLGVRRVLKLLQPDLARNSPHLIKRFSRESRCLAKLQQLGIAETQRSPGRAAAKKGEDVFDIHARAMAIAQRVAMRRAMTRSIALSGLPPPTERLEGSPRPHVSELLDGTSQKWQGQSASSQEQASRAAESAPVTRASSPGVGFALPPVGPGGTLPLAAALGAVQKQASAVSIAHASGPSEPPRAPSQTSQSSGSASEAVRGAQPSVAAKRRAASRRRIALNMGLGALVAALILVVVYYLVIRRGQ